MVLHRSARREAGPEQVLAPQRNGGHLAPDRRGLEVRTVGHGQHRAEEQAHAHCLQQDRLGVAGMPPGAANGCDESSQGQGDEDLGETVVRIDGAVGPPRRSGHFHRVPTRSNADALGVHEQPSGVLVQVQTGLTGIRVEVDDEGVVGVDELGNHPGGNDENGAHAHPDGCDHRQNSRAHAHPGQQHQTGCHAES